MWLDVNSINAEAVRSITLSYIQPLTKPINVASVMLGLCVWTVRPVSLHLDWVSLTCSVNVIRLNVAHCLTKQIDSRTENRTVVCQCLSVTTGQILDS